MKTTAIIILAVLLSNYSSAQQEYSFTHYFEANSFYNPAATGSREGQQVTGLFRRQWTGYEKTPLTGGIIYDTRLDKLNMGLGGFVFTDRVGATVMTNIVANYSYSLKFSNDLRLAFGVDGGVDVYSTDYDRLVYWDNDPMFDNQKGTSVVPRAGVGTQFYSERFYVGLAIPRLINFNNQNPLSIDAQNLPSIVSNYYLSAGYRFDLGGEFELQTNILGKYTARVPPQGDINVMGIYKKMIGLGIGYKSLGFGTAFVQYTYNEVVKIGYAFDMSLNEIAGYSNGTHEVMLHYSIPKRASKASR